jgi:YfiH family protein
VEERRDGWRIHVAGGVTLIRCEALERPGIEHAFSTRLGDGGSAFDLGAPGEPDAAAGRRRAAFCRAAGLAGRRPSLLRQVHGADLVVLGGGAPADGVAADAAIAMRSNAVDHAPAVRWADCACVLLVDAPAGVVAAVHAGWRGVAAGVVPRTLGFLAEIGARADSLTAVLGPSIGPCCYEVGADCLDAVASAVPGGAARIEPSPRRLDLKQAVRLQLEAGGVDAAAIHVSPWCTACEERLFFSWRRDGGPTGRQMACIGWSAPAAP